MKLRFHLTQQRRKTLFAFLLVFVLVCYPESEKHKKHKRQQSQQRANQNQASSWLSRTWPFSLADGWWRTCERWRLALAGVTAFYLLNNGLIILGWAVQSSLAERHYSRHFRNTRRFLTGMDAGIVSSLPVANKFLRDTVALVLGLWYVLFNAQGEAIMHRFHQEPTLQGIRRCWTKGRHPVLWSVSQLKDAHRRIAIHRRAVTLLSREDGRAILCYLYFQGSERQLQRARRVVLHYPGGGFVAQNPRHHECYLRKYASYLGPFAAVLSVDYRKAPEFPYPAGFDDCYEVYRTLVESAGSCIGLVPRAAAARRLKVVVTGDSAGGNMAAAVALRAVGERLAQIPDGVVLAYPCLDLDLNVLKASNFDADFECGNMTSSIVLSLDDEDEEEKEEKEKRKESILNSHAQFYADGVLPMSYLITLANAYLPPTADPSNDPFLSPVRASRYLLSRYPATRIHVGSVDPMVDDSRRFVQRLRRYNAAADVELVEWKGLSHAYAQTPTFFLQESRYSCELSIKWFSQLLGCPIQNERSLRYFSSAL